MRNDAFFEELKEQSAVKTAIVSKYFWSWAQVIMPRARKSGEQEIAYLDLFAGPGRHKDGTQSTPLVILEKAIQDPQMSQMLVAIFNDNNVQDLKKAIARLPGIDKLKHKPIVWNKEVGSEMAEFLSSINLLATLFFVDPWGYKGLSLQLVRPY